MHNDREHDDHEHDDHEHDDTQAAADDNLIRLSPTERPCASWPPLDPIDWQRRVALFIRAERTGEDTGWRRRAR